MSDLTKQPVLTAQQDSLLHVAGEAVRKLLREPEWERRLYEVMEDLGRTVDASRCYVFEKQVSSRDGIVLRCQAEWTSPELAAQASSRADASIALGSDADLEWLDHLSTGKRVDHLEEACPRSVRDTLRARNVKSLMLAPVFADGEWWGCIGLDDCTTSRDWSEPEQSALHIVADALGAAVERRSVEQERARVSAIVRYSDDAIIAKNLDGTITDWSIGASRIYGYSTEEMVGESVERLIPDDAYDEWIDIMQRLRAGEAIDHYETVRVRKDGMRLIVSISISPIRDGRGNLAGAVTIARDITESKQTEIELRSSEERLRLALDAGRVGAWDWDIETGQVIWSENMERLHGIEPGSFEGTFEHFKRGIYPDDRDAVVEAIQQSLESGHDYQVEYRSLTPDNQVVWLGARGRVIKDSYGRPVRMTGICSDISEQKRIDELQRDFLAQLEAAHAEAESERRKLVELFQHAPALMALLEGPDHVCQMANDHYLQAVGLREVHGKPVAEALPEVMGQGLIGLLDHVYTTGETIVRSELPVYLDVWGTGAPEERYFSFAYQATRNARGQVSGVLVHAVDLTDHVRSRKRVEELARETATERDRLQQIIDVLPEAIAITDETGTFVLANEAAYEIWGQPAPEGDYSQYTAFECYYPDFTEYSIEDLPLSRSILQGETVLGEQLLIRNLEHGNLIPTLVNCVPLRDERKRITGAVAVFQDITPLKDFERQKDEFLQAVSHDLKNPLTTIRGYSQLLARTKPSDPDRFASALENMDAATSRAIALLDEILDLTRLQMGRPLELSLAPVDLVELVSRMVEQHQATTEHHTVQIETDQAELVGEWDAVRLERVLANLLTNAITYSPEGGSIWTRVYREDAGSDPVAVIEVQDEGLGIPAQELPRLFERFWRGSNVREQYRGTGLGLAGVRAIVEVHGGTVLVDSVEGQGSTFTVRLPISDGDSGDA